MLRSSDWICARGDEAGAGGRRLVNHDLSFEGCFVVESFREEDQNEDLRADMGGVFGKQADRV